MAVLPPILIEVRQGSNAWLRRVEFYVTCSECSFVTAGTPDPDEAEIDRQKHVALHEEATHAE